MKNSNFVREQIEYLRSLMNQSLVQIDKDTIQRFRKVDTRHILYCLCLKVCHQIGYQEAVTKMESNNIFEQLSHHSINNKILSGTYIEHFNRLNQKLVQNLFPSRINNTMKKVAVDGSHIPLPYSLRHKGYLRIGKNPYTTGLISTIYDLENQIPLSYCLEKSLNERKIATEQFSKMDQPTMLIGDRGYFSQNIILKNLRLHFQKSVGRIKFQLEKFSSFEKNLKIN